MQMDQKKGKIIPIFLVALLIHVNAVQVYASGLVSGKSENLCVNMFQVSFSVLNKEYEADVYYRVSCDGKPRPAVIFAHGFLACKEWHTWIGKYLARSGYVALLFTVPDRFSTDVQLWVNGIKGGMECLARLNDDSYYLSNMINMSRLGVMGHSMGAMAAIIAASSDPRIKVVVSLAAPYMKDEHYDDEYAEELRVNIDWDCVLSASHNISIPVQFQVGSLDAFAANNAETYFKAANSSLKEFITIEGGNHVQYLDDKPIWSHSSLEGLIPLILIILSSLSPFTIISLIISFLRGEITIPDVNSLIEAATIFGIDMPATKSTSEQHEMSAQAFLTFFDLNL